MSIYYTETVWDFTNLPIWTEQVKTSVDSRSGMRYLPLAASGTVVRPLEKSRSSGKCWPNDLARMCRNVDFPSTVFVVLSYKRVKHSTLQHTTYHILQHSKETDSNTGYSPISQAQLALFILYGHGYDNSGGTYP